MSNDKLNEPGNSDPQPIPKEVQDISVEEISDADYNVLLTQDQKAGSGECTVVHTDRIPTG